jgi:hypothetical protein
MLQSVSSYLLLSSQTSILFVAIRCFLKIGPDQRFGAYVEKNIFMQKQGIKQIAKALFATK